MVKNEEIPDLWNNSGLSEVKPLECRINDNYNKKYKENKEGIK